MGACKPLRLVSQVGIEPTTRGLKVPCSTTELLARLLDDSIRQRLRALSAFYTPGEVEGYNERYYERRQHPELHEEVGELTRSYTPASISEASQAKIASVSVSPTPG